MNNNRPEPSLDDRLEAMGRLERRRLLLRLATTIDDDPRIDFSGLKRTGGEMDPLIAMRHLHLPVLEEREFIRWDRENQRITRGPRFDELEPLLELLREVRCDLPDRTVADVDQ